MHEERLAKGPRAEEIHVLLAALDIGCDAGERLRDRRRELGSEHRDEIGLAEIIEAVPPCAFHELVEVERLVHRFEMIMEDVIVALLSQLLGLLL